MSKLYVTVNRQQYVDQHPFREAKSETCRSEKTHPEHLLPSPRRDGPSLVQRRLVVVVDVGTDGRAGVLRLDATVAFKDSRVGRDRTVREDFVGAVLPQQNGLDCRKDTSIQPGVLS